MLVYAGSVLYDTGENGVSNVVPPSGECRAAAWRMTQTAWRITQNQFMVVYAGSVLYGGCVKKA